MRHLILPFFLVSLGVTGQNTFPTPSGEVKINTNTNFSGYPLSLGGSLIFEDPSPSVLTDNYFYVTEANKTSSGAVDAEFGFMVGGPGSNTSLQGPSFYMAGVDYSRRPDFRGFMGLYSAEVVNPVGKEGQIEIWGSHGIRFVTKSNSYEVKAFLSDQGNLGIGTINPQSKLSVKGNMESQEVQVKATVADYVFSTEYQIMSLEDLENYIAENNHLPRIQTQKEVDENRGLVKLGELSVSLMEKVEELTLYIIEMNKRLKVLEEENTLLKLKQKQLQR